MASRITLLSRVRFEQLATPVLELLVRASLSDSDGGHSGAAIPTPTSRVMRLFMSNAALGGILFVLSGFQATLATPRWVVASSKPTPSTSWSSTTRSSCGAGRDSFHRYGITGQKIWLSLWVFPYYQRGELSIT